MNKEGENGRGEFSLKGADPNTTFDIQFTYRERLDSFDSMRLATFATDVNGNASGTFQMPPGVYSGYFNALDQARTKALLIGNCGGAGGHDRRSFVRSSTVTVGRYGAPSGGGDPLSWGRADYSTDSQGRAVVVVELNGAAPNKTYDVTSGEMSCAYAQAPITTDASGNAKKTIELTGCGVRNLYLLDSSTRHFQIGLVVK